MTRACRVSLVLGCVGALVAGVMACAGISDLSGPKPVTAEQVVTVEVSQSQATIGVGGTVALQALARDVGGHLLPGRRTYWSSSDSTVARVSVGGLVTALRTGSALIAATVDGKSAVTTVTVTPRAVASVQITPSNPQVYVGGSTQLTARTLDDIGGDVTGRTITWTSNDTHIAVVDQSGRVTGVAVGTVTVTATSEGHSASVGFTVAPVPVATIQVTPPLDTVVIGQSTQRSAVLRDSAGALLTDRAVSWSSNALPVATVSSSGLVIGAAPGSATITASSEGRSGTSQVVVRVRPVSAVIVSPSQASLTVGQSVTLTVQITDVNGNLLTGRPTQFQSGNSSVAQVSTDGKVIGVAPGVTTITVTSEGRVGTASITVAASPIATLRVDPPSGDILVGATLKLGAVLLDAAGNVLSQRPVVWTTGAPSIASVAIDGTVTGVGVGTAIIFATVEGRVASVPVQVRAVPVGSVFVSPTVNTIIVGDLLDLTAQVRDAAGNPLGGRTVVWSSSNDQLAVVSSTGRVRALAAGVPKIFATADGVSGNATVTVTVEPVLAVTVSPTTLGMLPGQTAQITATPTGRNGAPLTGRGIAYATADPLIATVSATGVVTAVAVGNTVITATCEGRQGSVPVSITPTPVATVDVALASSSIFVGVSTQATATTKAANGSVLPGRVVVWSSSNPAVATVTSAGVVTALSVGTSNIIATSEGKTGSATLTTTPAPVANVAVAVTASARFVGETTQSTATLRDALNNVLTGRTIVWSTSNALVATVSATGLVTAVGSGTANIIATSEGIPGLVAVTVTLAPVATVVVTLGSSALLVGQNTQATAVLRDLNNFVLSGRVISWSSSNALVASVSATGVVTALLPGTATITATSEGKNGTATVNVSLVPVATVTVSLGSTAINVGATTQATAVTQDSVAGVLTGRTVVWSTSNAAIATVSPTGLVTAVAPGNANIIATSEGKTGLQAVTVSLAPVATVSVALTASTIILGQGTQATATLRDNLSLVLTGRIVVWSSSNPAVATVTQAGVVTSVGVGTANIIATSEGIAGQATLTVSPVPVNSVTVALAASVFIGFTAQATATTLAADNSVLTGRTIVWSTSNAAVATVNAATGAVTGVSVGSAVITATSEGKTGTASITVALAPVNTVTVSLLASAIVIGGSTTATATTFDANNTVLTGRVIAWSSSNPAVATVNAVTGVVTGVSVGSANIIATSEGKTGLAVVSVGLAPVSTVTVGLGSSSIFVLATTQATATLRDAINLVLTGRAIVWSSSNPAVATVNAATGVVTGVSVGSANIIATSEGKTGLAAVSVALAPVNTVTVGLQSTNILVLGTTQATATLKDVNNNVLTGRTIAWSSSNTAVATVNAVTGVVTGVGVGTANIIATSETVTGLASVSVGLAPVSSVTVGLQSASIFVAFTTQATATLRDANNNVLTGRTIAWSSSNTAVATVNAVTGVVTGVGVGTANIIATSETITGQTAVTVSLAPVSSVTVGLQSASIFVAFTTQATATLKDANNNVLTGRTIAWSSSNTAVATVNAVTGVVTGVGVGTANIIATSETITGQTAVTVSLAPVNTVNVSLLASAIVIGGNTTASATTFDANNNQLSGRVIAWSSSNPAVATVNAATGVVTGVGVGTANIIATSEGKTGLAAVSVGLAPVSTVTVGLQSSAIFIAFTTQATATLKDANNNVLTGRTIAWSSSNTAVATVNAVTGVVTGVGVGTANIIATSETITGQTAVTVSLAPVNSVTVGLQASSIFVAFNTQATATLRDANNNVLTGRTITWSSSNTAVATVDAVTGLVTGVGAGSANIIATSETVSGQTAVTVSLAPVSTVTVGLQSTTIAVLATTQATATLKDANNNTLTGRTIVWTSDNTAVATVDPSTGVITAVAAGTANIVATSEGVVGQATVTVTAQQ